MRANRKHRSVIQNSGWHGKGKPRADRVCKSVIVLIYLISMFNTTMTIQFKNFSPSLTLLFTLTLLCFLHRTYYIGICYKIYLFIAHSVHLHSLRCKLQRLVALSSLLCPQYLSDPQKIFVE